MGFGCEVEMPVVDCEQVKDIDFWARITENDKIVRLLENIEQVQRDTLILATQSRDAADLGAVKAKMRVALGNLKSLKKALDKSA